jgi:hypothetical protein
MSDKCSGMETGLAETDEALFIHTVRLPANRRKTPLPAPDAEPLNAVLCASACCPRRAQSLCRHLHRPYIVVSRLNDVRAPVAGDIVILEGSRCRPVQRTHAVRFGDLIGFGRAAVGVCHDTIVRRAAPQDNRTSGYGRAAILLERGEPWVRSAILPLWKLAPSAPYRRIAA